VIYDYGVEWRCDRFQSQPEPFLESGENRWPHRVGSPIRSGNKVGRCPFDFKIVEPRKSGFVKHRAASTVVAIREGGHQIP